MGQIDVKTGRICFLKFVGNTEFKKVTIRTTTFLSFLCSFLKIVTSYRCLQCDDVPLPNLCQEVGECGPHELCAVEQYVTTAGSLTYRQRCMDRLNCGNIVQSGLGKRSDLLTCSECCEGDLCNAAGCGQKGFDTTLGPVCFACALQIGTGTCSKIQQCGRDQECSIHPVRRIGAPDNLFETKCLETHICTAPEVIDPTFVGRKRSTCSVCCNSTLCNDFDSRPCVQSPSTTPIIISTKVTTLPPTTKALTSNNHESVRTTTKPNPFTTAPVTQQVCEDVPGKLCDVITCTTAVDFNRVNCRKTCNLCEKVTESTSTTTTSTTASTSVSTGSTPTATTTTTSPVFVSTTTKTGVSSHTHDPFCFDVSEGCKTFLNYCIIDEYKDWTKENCKRTCNYC